MNLCLIDSVDDSLGVWSVEDLSGDIECVGSADIPSGAIKCIRGAEDLSGVMECIGSVEAPQVL